MTDIAEQSESAALQELISKLDPEHRTLLAEAVLGADAKQLFTSELGQYMVGCAKQDYAEAMVKLKRTLPWRWRRIQQLQNEARVAEQFMTYLRDLIIRGKAAELSLEEREES